MMAAHPINIRVGTSMLGSTLSRIPPPRAAMMKVSEPHSRILPYDIPVFAATSRVIVSARGSMGEKEHPSRKATATSQA